MRGIRWLPIFLFAAAIASQNLWDGARSYLPESLRGSRFIRCDLDADGDLDLVCPFGSLRPVAVGLNRGDGVFRDAPAANLGQAVSFADVAVAADVDGDADVDLWFDGVNASSPSLWRNDGSGRFTDVSASAVPAGLTYVNDIAVLDIEGDGDLDVWFAMGLSFPTMQRIGRNDGTGRFTLLPFQHNQGFSQACSQILPVDTDRDGDTDIVAVDPISGVYHGRNDGAGMFTIEHLMVSVGSNQRLVVGDVDADSDPDIFHSPTQYFLVNNGSGSFPALRSLPFRYTATVDLLEDLDGDGDPDMLGDVLLSHPQAIFRNNGTGGFAAEAFQWGWDPHDPLRLMHGVRADFDNDGLQDLLTDAPTRRGLMFGHGDGGYTDSSPPMPRVHPEIFTVADFDGDTTADIVFLEQTTLILLRNDGFGAFAAECLGPRPSGIESLGHCDVDGDGDHDLVTRGNNLEVLLNDSRGVFIQGSLTPWIDAARFVTVDFDRDGALDLIDVRRAWNHSARIPTFLRNDRAGAFIDVTGTATQWLVGPDPVVGDVNGDLAPDLVATEGSDRLGVFLNDGHGVFTQLLGAVAARRFPTPLLLADLDGDGDNDLVSLSRSNTNAISIELDWNAGGGTFTRNPTPLTTPIFDAIEAAGPDIDGDGDQDLLLRPAGPPFLGEARLELWRNDHNRTLTRIPTETAPLVATHPRLLMADFDGDGDLDGLHGDPFLPFVSNLDRQVRLLERARAGRALTIRVDRQPRQMAAPGIAFLALGAGSPGTPVVIPGFGRTCSTLGSAWIAPPMVVAAPSGAGELVTTVPNVVALIGQAFWLQAAVVSSGNIVLTNLVREVVAR